MPHDVSTWQCPSPPTNLNDTITLAHGEGGRLLRRLLHETIFPVLGQAVECFDDSAVLTPPAGELAFTTDSFVVSPLFFPGGDIGRLAVFGTSNDLAVAGAQPLWISLALIVEEGLSLTTLARVLQSVAASATEVGVRVATGDTKVVPRGTADGLFINTAGIGHLLQPAFPGPGHLEPGDELLVSGPIGQHGMAVMAAREGLNIEPTPISDCASLVPAVEVLRAAEIPIVALRDATRGGVAAVLHEWAAASGAAMAIDERQVPVSTEVRGVCELLGLDPLHVANEGTMVAAVRGGFGTRAVEALRRVPIARQATIIGQAQVRDSSPVLVKRGLARYLPLDEPLGAPLPRIC